MRPHEFKVNLLVHEDGTFTAQGVDLRGLVLETKTLAEMREELLSVTPRLLRSNHQLSDDEIEQTLIHIDTYYIADDSQGRRGSGAPRLVGADYPPLAACA